MKISARLTSASIFMLSMATAVNVFGYGLRCDYDFRGSSFAVEATRIERQSSTGSTEYRRGQNNTPETYVILVVRHKNLDNEKNKKTNFAISTIFGSGVDSENRPINQSLIHNPQNAFVSTWKNFEIRNHAKGNERRVVVNVERQLVSIYEPNNSKPGSDKLIQADIPATCKTGRSEGF